MKSRQPLSLQAHLLILVAAIALPLAAVVAYSVYGDTRHAIEGTSSTVRTLATVIAANTERTLGNNRERLELLAQRPLMRAVAEGRCDPILADFQELFPRFANLTSIDLTGKAVCSAVPQPGGKPVDVFATEWFQRALREKRFLAGLPFRGPITGKWVSVLVVPISGENKELKGFMGLPMDLGTFDPNITGVAIPDGSRYGIVAGDGTLIWRSSDPEQLVGTKRSDLSAVRKILEIRNGTFDEFGVDGVHRHFAVMPIGAVDWYAFAAVPSAAIRAHARSSALRSGALGTLGVLLVVALAVFLARRIERPMKALANAARSVNCGDIDARAEVTGPQEVVEVSTEFNTMVAAWSSSVRQLQDSEERFRTVADYAGDWEYWEGPQQQILYMSPSCERITGYGREQFIADAGLLDRVVHPDDRGLWASHRHAAGGTPSAALDFRILRSDGQVRWISHHCAAVGEANGREHGHRVSNRDITDRKLLEKEREEYFKFFNTSTDLMGIADPGGAFKKVNPAFLEMLGYSEAELLAHPFVEFIHPDDRQSTVEEMTRQLQLGFSLDFENRYLCKDGSVRWLSWRANVNRAEGLTYAVARDITERKNLDARLARLSDLYATLGDANEAIVRIRDRSVLLQEIGRIVVAHGHLQAAWVGIVDADGWLKTVAQAGSRAGYFATLNVSSDAALAQGQGPGGIAFRERKHVVFNDFLHDEAARPWQEAAEREGFRAVGAFPLWTDGKVIGVLGLYAGTQGFFDEELCNLVLRLTEDVSLALDNLVLDERRRQAEEGMWAFGERLKLATEAAAIGVWEIDAKKQEVIWDDRMFEMFGLQRIEPMTYERWRQTIHPDDLSETEAALRQAYAGGRVKRFVFRIVRPDNGTVRYIQSDAAANVDERGQVSKVVGINFDITESKRMEEELRNLAITDALTGLPNRRHFLERLDEQLARVHRRVTDYAAVLMLDLDHFKRINDIHGHAVGDAVLKHFADVVREELRKIDSIGRMGGEEFAIVLPGAAPAAAQSFAERLCRKVADSPLTHAGLSIPVTVSIGIAELIESDTAADAVLVRADEALYRAKEGGRNRVCLAATSVP